MNKVKTIDELIDLIISSRKDELKLYSSSFHKKYAERIINDLVNNNSEYYEIAFCFCEFALQYWCDEKRKKLGIDIESLGEAIASNSNFFGLKTHNDMWVQKESLLITKKVIDKIIVIVNNDDNLLTKSEIKAIQDVFFGYDSSKYIVCNYFESAVEKIFSTYYLDFSLLFEEKDKLLDMISDDIILTFHNIENLLFISNEYKNSAYFNYNEVDFKKANKTLNEAISLLDNYPFTSDLKRIMHLYSKGYNELKISKYMNKSRTYIKKRYDEGLDVLEKMIWGVL